MDVDEGSGGGAGGGERYAPGAAVDVRGDGAAALGVVGHHRNVVAVAEAHEELPEEAAPRREQRGAHVARRGGRHGHGLVQLAGIGELLERGIRGGELRGEGRVQVRALRREHGVDRRPARVLVSIDALVNWMNWLFVMCGRSKEERGASERESGRRSSNAVLVNQPTSRSVRQSDSQTVIQSESQAAKSAKVTAEATNSQAQLATRLKTWKARSMLNFMTGGTTPSCGPCPPHPGGARVVQP